MKTSIQCLPDYNSPIVHSYAAGEHEGGIYSAIFFDAPEKNMKELFPMKVEQPAVYVISVGKTENFKPFKMMAHTAIVLSIPDYLALLAFFRDDWTQQEIVMNEKIKLMREKTSAIDIDVGLQFLGHGYVKCFTKFDNNVSLVCRRDSRDVEERFFVHLFKEKQNVVLYPSVLKKMSKQLHLLLQLWENYPHKTQRQTVA